MVRCTALKWCTQTWVMSVMNLPWWHFVYNIWRSHCWQHAIVVVIYGNTPEFQKWVPCPRLAVTAWAWKCTIEFLGYGKPYNALFGYSSWTCHVANDHWPTANLPTTSRHGLSQYAPLTIVSETHKNWMWMCTTRLVKNWTEKPRMAELDNSFTFLLS